MTPTANVRVRPHPRRAASPKFAAVASERTLSTQGARQQTRIRVGIAEIAQPCGQRFQTEREI